MEYFVYILLSQKDNELYIGYTNDIQRRFREHTQSQVSATKHRLPLRLIHYEVFINLQDAKARETFLKSGFGHNQLKSKLKYTLKCATSDVAR
ncbi:GIY-YIG nuclease family protein [Patescibacteria group bacterium]|nr:GIY-YIG nuclease family protein [Patescibacteria group bacterium]